MISKEDVNAFNVTFKTSNEVYVFVMNWMRSYPSDIEIISEEILPDTNELYQNDRVFQKMVKDFKKMKNDKLNYILKNNK
tara:strand:+ start:205 stop:444 length:240 start_codon:yes stop_codon:yes gene_type:complete